MSEQYYCYFLRSLNTNHSRKTYIGCTNDLNRRLRQHNGEITGGAKRTSIGRPWQMICYFTGFIDRHSALSFEWYLHHIGVQKKRK